MKGYLVEVSFDGRRVGSAAEYLDRSEAIQVGMRTRKAKPLAVSVAVRDPLGDVVWAQYFANRTPEVCR